MTTKTLIALIIISGIALSSCGVRGKLETPKDDLCPREDPYPRRYPPNYNDTCK